MSYVGTISVMFVMRLSGSNSKAPPVRPLPELSHDVGNAEKAREAFEEVCDVCTTPVIACIVIFSGRLHLRNWLKPSTLPSKMPASS